MLTRILALGVCTLICSMPVKTADAQQQQLNWAEKMFSELRHDFGTVARGADTRASIVLTNIYEENITINNVGTTCGCTAARPDRTSLKTHEKANIEIKMDTVKFMRRKDSNVDVTVTFHRADGDVTKTVRVPITAYIRSDVVITPEPGNANFGDVEIGATQERRLDVSYAGRDGWSIQSVKTPSGHIEATVRETFRGPGRVSYELLVRLKGTAPIGEIHDQISLVTDDNGAPEVPVLVVGRVVPDIVATPANQQLGNMRPGEVKQFRIVVRGTRPFVIAKISSENATNFEMMQPGTDSKTVHVVPFKLTVPAVPGRFSENLSIYIEGRPEPVIVKAEGDITAN